MRSELMHAIRQAQNEGYPQSLQMSVWHRGRKLIGIQSGKPFKYFDLASVTKILLTTTLAMRAYQKGLLSLQTPVKDVLGFLDGSPAGRVKIADLLRHHSGLAWWRPFYKSIQNKNAPMDELKRLFKKEPVRKSMHCVYSDLDFILLGWILEELEKTPLETLARNLYADLGLKNIFFPKSRILLKRQCAPTEKIKTRGVIQGEVFDENSYAMGGVSGHAGLFGTLEDVETFGNWLLATWLGKRKDVLSPKTVRYFTKRAVSPRVGDWGLGFVVPSRPVSTGGRLISKNAFGHTGFTGTSLWIDPKREAVVTILSNRTYPTRADERFKALRIELHDIVWRSLDEK